MFKKIWPELLVVILAVVFFFGTSAYNFLAQSPDFIKWSSPDETANYLSAKQYASTGELSMIIEDNAIADGIVAPRSMRADSVVVKPVSFLGMIILYGFLAKIFGLGVLPYLTPFFSALGLIFFYLLIKRLFNRQVALLSTCLLTFFPVYIYYSARSFFHNELFVVFLMVGFYLAILASQTSAVLRQKILYWFYAFLSGLLIGLAVTVRTSELVWLGPMLLLIWLFNLKRWQVMRPLLFAYAFVLAFAPIFFYNFILYGSPLASGYPDMDKSVTAIVSGGGGLVANAFQAKFDQTKQFLKQIYHSFFYFGFKPSQSWQMFKHFTLEMFPWLWYLSGAGLVIFCFKFWCRPKADLIYLSSFILSAVILVLYYGSWQYTDSINPDSFTLGNAYTRYWLPLYLFALPLASLAILRLTKIFKFKSIIISSRLALVLVICGLGVVYTLYGTNDSLVPSYYSLQASRQEFKQVLAVTEPDSLIITRYHDKLFFPERKVIVALFNDDAMNERYARLAKRWPIYYYNFNLKPEELAAINQEKLKSRGLIMKLKQSVTSQFSLYQLEFIK